MPKHQSTARKRARSAARGGTKYTAALRTFEQPYEPADPDPEEWAQPCANCGSPLAPENRTLFCEDGCRQVAHTVRWVRHRIADGTFVPAQVRYGLVSDEKYAEALYNRLRFAVADGYTRTVPAPVREEVIERDEARCVRCGRELLRGDVQVDHIAGDSSDPSNLQALCRSCHGQKTRVQSREGRRLLLRGEPVPSWRMLLRELAHDAAVRELIAGRILPAQPSRLCDDFTQWPQIWRALKSERRGHLEELLEELFDGAVPRFPPRTSWEEKMAAARDHHSRFHDEVPCSLMRCPECSGRNYGGGWLDNDPDSYPSIEAWLDDPDVHAGYGEGSYFAHAMAKDD